MNLVDQFGQPMTRKPATKELTFSFGRQLDSLGLTLDQNPDDLLQQQGYEVYDRVGRDPHVYGVMQIRRQAVAARPRTILPASQKRDHRKKAEFVLWNLQERLGAAHAVKSSGLSTNLTSWTQSMYDLTQAYADGFAMLELIWERHEGDPYPNAWVVSKIKPRDPDLFTFKPDGIYKKESVADLEGLKQPPFKYLHFAFDPNFSNPYGNSLYTKIYYYQKFKRHTITWWMTFLEKFAMPGMVGEFPWEETPTNQERIIGWLEDAIEVLRTRVGVVLPDVAKFRLLEASKSATDAYQAFCHFANQEISKAILGNELLTGTAGQPYGSQALAKSTTTLVHQAQLEADCHVLDDIITDQLCFPLIYFNFPGLDGIPKQQTDTDPGEDLNAKADRDTKLIQAGAQVGQAYIHETYGIPEPGENDPLVIASQAVTQIPA